MKDDMQKVQVKHLFCSSDEIILKEVMIEGLLSIQAGENPRVIEEKLKSFLSPNDRNSYGDGQEGGGDQVDG